jgi:putative Ca2+/H+ antiporter (TMEM165/GDT1 family)
LIFFLVLLVGFLQGLTKSLAMTVLSEVGDKTFFAAAVRRRLISPFNQRFSSFLALLVLA